MNHVRSSDACVLLSSAPAQTAPSPQTRPKAESIASYMVQLQKLHRRWQQAARLVHEGKRDQARSVMSGAGRRELPAAWRRRDLLLAVKLRGEEFYTTGAIPKALGEALWYAEAEVAELAVKAFTARQKAGVKLDFARKLRFAHCLVEDRKYEPARALLRELLATDPASDWKRTLQRRLEALDGLQGGQDPPLSFYWVWYVEVGAGWPRERVLPILRVWRAEVPPEKTGAKAKLLLRLFDQVGDFTGERLTLVWLSELAGSDESAAADAIVRAGQVALRARDQESALDHWARVVTLHPRTPAGRSAGLLIAGLLQRRGEHRKAIDLLEGLIREGATQPAGEHQTHVRMIRMQIGHCLLAMGKHAEALAAYNAAAAKSSFRPSLWQGLCCDHLGRHAEAAARYFEVAVQAGGDRPQVLIRLVELYRSAGQLGDLQAMCAEMDRGYHAVQRKKFTHGMPPSRPPSRVIGRAVQMRQWEQAGQLDKLVALLRIKGSTAGPEEYRQRVDNWEAIEAARLLALRAEKAVPLLEAKLAHCDVQDRKWVYYALGRCGGQRAVATLKEAGRKEKNIWWLLSVVYALSLAGEEGQAAIRDLSGEPDSNLRAAVRTAQRGELGDKEKDLIFPAIPQKLSLPKGPMEMP